MKDDSYKNEENLRFYTQISKSYDQCMVWDARLKSESPFFRKLFAENDVNTLLDAGCATGMHTIEFARWGLKVYGGDFSAEMLEQASKNAKSAGVSPKFFAADLPRMAKHVPEPLDAILCVGTTFPHISEADMKKSLTSFYTAIRPGGILLLQTVNFEKMYADNARFRPPRYWREGEEEKFFLRIYNFVSRTSVYVDMITLSKNGEKLDMTPETVNMRPFYREEISGWLQEAGFCECFFYGNYSMIPYDAKTSPDLVVIAKKRG